MSAATRAVDGVQRPRVLLRRSGEAFACAWQRKQQAAGEYRRSSPGQSPGFGVITYFAPVAFFA